MSLPDGVFIGWEHPPCYGVAIMGHAPLSVAVCHTYVYYTSIAKAVCIAIDGLYLWLMTSKKSTNGLQTFISRVHILYPEAMWTSLYILQVSVGESGGRG